MNNYNNKKPHKCEDNKCTIEYALFYITVSLNNRKYIKKINKMKQQLLKKYKSTNIFINILIVVIKKIVLTINTLIKTEIQKG